jgi:hypothetical protein
LSQTASGAWVLLPDPWLKLDVTLLKNLLFWRVVPTLNYEQTTDYMQLQKLLKMIDAALLGEESRLLNGLLAEVRDEFGDLERSRQVRYILDLAAGLTDTEFEALYKLFCTDTNPTQELEEIAREAALPPWPFALTSGHLTDVSPAEIKALYADLLTDGRRDGTGGLSPRSVQYVGTTLGRAFKDAVTQGVMVRNPSQGIRKPQ